MTTTPNLGMTLVEQSQSQKEVTINEALARLDALINTGAISVTNTPPGSPAQGDLYIVGASPTGFWAGQANAMVYYDQIWRFITPKNGMQIYVRSTSQFYLFNGTAWGAVSSGGGGGSPYGTLQTFNVGINIGNTAQSSPTTLDWYEEATFTPTVYGATTAGTCTYIVQNGQYTRIGNRVDFFIYVAWSGHTGTGEGRIAGLPYTNPNGAIPTCSFASGYPVTASSVLVCAVAQSGSYVRMLDTTVGTGALNTPNLSGAAYMQVKGTYFI